MRFFLKNWYWKFFESKKDPRGSSHCPLTMKFFFKINPNLTSGSSEIFPRKKNEAWHSKKNAVFHIPATLFKFEHTKWTSQKVTHEIRSNFQLTCWIFPQHIKTDIKFLSPTIESDKQHNFPAHPLQKAQKNVKYQFFIICMTFRTQELSPPAIQLD